MRDYETFARQNHPKKIPSWFHPDPRRRLGDAIYDFSFGPPRIRLSVHNETNRARDLSGKYALVSDHYFYLGDQPCPLPKHLRCVSQQLQGHRSLSNDGLLEPFLEWLYDLGLKPNRLYGKPQLRLFPELEWSEEDVRPCGNGPMHKFRRRREPCNSIARAARMC